MVVDGQFSGGVEYPTTVPCSSSSPPSKRWPAYWAGLLATQRPNVTMLMAGRWEVSDQVIHGQVMHIGQPYYDALLRADMDEAVRVGTSTGAYLMLLTAPCFDSGEQPNGQPWPEDSTARRLDYDRILDQVAAAHPRNVEVFNFGAEVCPGGHFESTIDGVRVRLSDGVHFPYQSGVDGSVAPTAKWLAWKLFPEAVRVGRLQMAGIPLR
jgi:hypothetical protein